MLVTSLPATRSVRLLSWPTVALVLLLIHAALSVTIRQSRIVTAYGLTTYFLVLVLAAGIAALNAVQSRKAIRLFWSFLAMALVIWSLNAFSWFYYALVQGRDHPPHLVSAVPLALHIVFIIAAVASRPHLKFSPHLGYRTTLNFLVLLFFWTFVYALLWIANPFTDWNTAIHLRGQALYILENFFLLVVLSVLIVRADAPWKSIYRHLLGASALYILGSSMGNYLLVYKRYHRGLTDIPYMAAAYWFVWLTLRGRKLAPQLAQADQPDTGDTKYTSLLAMLSVLVVPAVGVWELLRADEPYQILVIRLLIVLTSVLLLAGFVFVREYLTNRELFSDVGLANERLRSAMESGKAMGWEWDLKTGRADWFGDLNTMFGMSSRSFAGGAEDFQRYVHPEDRQQVSDAVANARRNHKPYAAEFRVVWPDGTVRWVAASGKFHYSPHGEPERMSGMAVDINDRKVAEEAVSGLSRRLISAQEQERSRIARELHDDIGQRLALLAVELGQFDSPDLPAEVGGRIAELQKQSSEIAGDVQSLSHQLHSSKLEYLGVTTAMRAFCKEFSEQQNVEIVFACHSIPRTVPSDISLCLYRVLQEALHNAVKYSGVRHFDAELSASSEAIHLTVRDSGSGFDVEERMQGSGLGLISMTERIKLVGGHLSIESRPGHGATIHARVPLREATKAGP
jgi:PAS domain S-box-containing protein